MRVLSIDMKLPGDRPACSRRRSNGRRCRGNFFKTRLDSQLVATNCRLDRIELDRRAWRQGENSDVGLRSRTCAGALATVRDIRSPPSWVQITGPEAGALAFLRADSAEDIAILCADHGVRTAFRAAHSGPRILNHISPCSLRCVQFHFCIFSASMTRPRTLR